MLFYYGLQCQFWFCFFFFSWVRSALFLLGYPLVNDKIAALCPSAVDKFDFIFVGKNHTNHINNLSISVYKHFSLPSKDCLPNTLLIVCVVSSNWMKITKSLRRVAALLLLHYLLLLMVIKIVWLWLLVMDVRWKSRDIAMFPRRTCVSKSDPLFVSWWYLSNCQS